jgi:hypothetical protein
MTPSSGLAWRQHFDNARYQVDDALRELNRALVIGLVSEADYVELDRELRSQQVKLAREPKGLAPLVTSAKSRIAFGWARRRPRRSPDREKSRQRARMLGGSSSLPPQLRAAYTECERAVLTVVAGEVKHHGICDLSVGQIAAEAGVCVRTVQNAVAEAVRQGHLGREEREQKGRKNLTNVLRIVSAEWFAWIKRGPIGCKVFSATKIIGLKQEAFDGSEREFPRVARILRVSG